MIIDYSEYITEKASKGLVNFLTVDNRLPLFVHNSICPFCKEKIESTVYSTKKTDYPEWLYGQFDQREQVVQCSKCGWWEYKYSNQSDAILLFSTLDDAFLFRLNDGIPTGCCSFNAD